MPSVNETTLQGQYVPDTPGDWTQTLSFGQFDPSLGTLVGVSVGVEPDVYGSIWISNLDGSATPFSVDLVDDTTVTGPGNTYMVSAAAEALNSGTVAAAGSASFIMTGTTAVAFSQQASGLDAAAFIGGGTVPLTASASTTVTISGPANMQVSSLTSSGAAVAMLYTYVPASGGGGYGDAGFDFVGIGNFGPYTIFHDGEVTSAPQSFSFADNLADWNDSLPAAQFNPALGTLEAVNLTLSGTIDASVAAINDDTDASSVNTMQTVTVSLGSYLTVAAMVGDSRMVAPGGSFYDGNLVGSDSGDTTLTDAGDLAAFTGNGTIALPMSAIGAGTVSGQADLLATLLAQSGATATVSFTYVPTGVTANSVEWWGWTGGSWTDGNEWGTGSVPQSTDDVAITDDGTYTVTLDSPQTIHSLVIDAPGATLVLDANLRVTGDIFLDAGTIEFNGGTLSVDDLIMNGGTITGGNADIHAAGSIAANGGTVVANSVTLVAPGGVVGAAASEIESQPGSTFMAFAPLGVAGDTIPASAGIGSSPAFQFATGTAVLTDGYSTPTGDNQIEAASVNPVITFINGAAGGADMIRDFIAGQDHIRLSGYGLGVVPAVLQSAVATAGGTTVTLPDGTSITVAGVDHLRASDFITG